VSTSVDESPPPVAKGTEEASTAPEPDGVHGRVVIVVAIATVLVGACSVAVAWTIAQSPTHVDRAARWGAPKADVQAIEMSILPRTDAVGAGRTAPADASSEPRRVDRQAERRLSSYGYSDRGRGTVHIPLDRAKQLFLERERARVQPRELPAGRRPK
jgi:hypothetical protein